MIHDKMMRAREALQSTVIIQPVSDGIKMPSLI